MFLILKSDKDTYITDSIFDGKRRTDANVGRAGTIDIYHLFDEKEISGTSEPREVTRALVHFNLNPLRALTGSSIDITSTSFKAFLKLTDVFGGQTTPSNFTLAVFPLSKSFDEGIGRDVSSFRDLDSANWLTASVSGQVPVTWSQAGANKSGSLDSTDLDIIDSGNLGSGVENLFVTQTFSSGEEDLEVDITKVVSGVLTNQIPDFGFRISFSGTQEQDTRTRFVKRFASRHSTNPRITPRILVKYDDSLHDHHESFFFDLSGTLFLRNNHRGVLANILSGSNLTQISGNNSLLLTITSGSVARGTYFQQIMTASQHSIGATFVSGVYSSSFAISSEATASLKTEILNAGSGTFSVIWGALDGTVGYHTGTLVIKSISRSSFANVNTKTILSVTNLRPEYSATETVRFRVFAQSDNRDDVIKTKLPREATSLIFTNMHYQIRDENSDEVIIPFDTTYNSTLMSTDSKGMYFDVPMSGLDIGAVYVIEIQYSENGVTQEFGPNKVGARFRVVK